MPIQQDDRGRRRVEMALVVPGTPEQVWEALATGPGYEAWFTRATVDGCVGGAITFDFGAAGESSGVVTGWDPPHRFAYEERDWMEGAPPVATEITVTARRGGRCVVRMVHSLFASTDDWDDQLEGFESGWAAFFDVLRVYLTHAAGQPATLVSAFESTAMDTGRAWQAAVHALGGVPSHAGDRWTPPDGSGLSGVLEYLSQTPRQRHAVVHLDAPCQGARLVGVGSGATAPVSMALYLYGDEAGRCAATAGSAIDGWIRRLRT
ncbi:MAG: SRPBCC domain-containing protein [Vicinamibacterales bacterium]